MALSNSTTPMSTKKTKRGAHLKYTRRKRSSGKRTKRRTRVRLPAYNGPTWDTIVASTPGNLIHRDQWDRDDVKLNFIDLWASEFAQEYQSIPIVTEARDIPGSFWVRTPLHAEPLLWTKANFVREHAALVSRPLPKATVSLQ